MVICHGSNRKPIQNWEILQGQSMALVLKCLSHLYFLQELMDRFPKTQLILTGMLYQPLEALFRQWLPVSLILLAWLPPVPSYGSPGSILTCIRMPHSCPEAFQAERLAEIGTPSTAGDSTLWALKGRYGDQRSSVFSSRVWF